ncbi:MAG: WecB/TagA/CpsF family glycosyltransferase, partial [bacterium]
MASAVGEARPHQVVTANALMLNAAQSDPALAEAIRGADLVVPDGAGLLLASRLSGRPLRERVPGIDLMQALCEAAARRGWRVLLMGAKPGVALAAAERLRSDIPGLAISAVRDGYFRRDEEPAVLHDIRVATPDLLFVGLGMDRQERWIAQNLNALGARVVMGVGGALD